MDGNNESENKNKLCIRPEDIARIVLKNLRIWQTLDKIEENLKKIIWFLEDERYDKLADEFQLES